MFEKLCKRMKGEGGFTLIELLVVIIIIAILAAIAIPTFLGQRQKAQDASAKSLVRNAMTAVESQYVDTKSFVTASAIAAATLIEPSITFNSAAAAVANVGATVCAGVSLAKDADVDYNGDANSYSIATLSESGNEFAVFVNKGSGGGTTFVKEIVGAATPITSGW